MEDRRCRFCPFSTAQESVILDHMKQHSYLSNCTIKCFYCPTTLRNIKTYNQHQPFCHGQKQSTISTEQNPIAASLSKLYICKVDSCQFQAEISGLEETFETPAQHTRSHLLPRNSKSVGKVECFVCNKEYKAYSSYCHHLQKHKICQEIKVRDEKLQIRSGSLPNGNQESCGPGVSETTESGGSHEEPEIAGIENLLDKNSSNPAQNEAQRMKPGEMMNNLNKTLEELQTFFFLKLTAKDLVSNDVVNDIVAFSEEVHEIQLNIICLALRRDLHNGEDAVKVVKCIDFVQVQLTD